MSIENGQPRQLQLFAEEEAAARAAAQAELDDRISRVGDTSHVATLDPELVELQAKNLENGSGFTPRMVDRASQTPAEAYVNTAPRPPRKPRRRAAPQTGPSGEVALRVLADQGIYIGGYTENPDQN